MTFTYHGCPRNSCPRNSLANGQLLATYEFSTAQLPTAKWTFALNDWLGTKRVVANADGTQAETCTGLPFGDGPPCTGTGDPSPQHFTGKERDTESNNDYFGARYYSNTTGRFLSADPVFITPARLADPQRLNLYNYGRNNPWSYLDVDGEDISLVNDTDDGRRAALGEVTQHVTAAEAANIQVTQDKNGAWQAQVKDAGAVSMKDASTAYKGVVGVINDHSINVNVGLIGGGLTATFPGMGQISSTSQFAETDNIPGSRDVNVMVTQGSLPQGVEVLTPYGVMRGSEPDSVALYHELVGETLKYRAGHTSLQMNPELDSRTVIKIENELRRSAGMYPRTGSDHGAPVITVNGSSK